MRRASASRPKERSRNLAWKRRCSRPISEPGKVSGPSACSNISRNVACESRAPDQAAAQKALGLRCKQKRRFKATTNSKHGLPVAPNLLNQDFSTTAPNQAWCGDITYIATDEGRLYLAGLKDLYSGEIVGYSRLHDERTNDETSGHAGLVSRRCHQTAACRSDSPHRSRVAILCVGLSIAREPVRHAGIDEPSRQLLRQRPIESFWGTLKNELVYHQRFATREQARHSISEYIELFYNWQCSQAHLHYQSPVAFTQRFYLNPIAA